jgi:hypothetical protein
MPPTGLAAALMFMSRPRDRLISILQCGSPEVCRFLGRLHHKTILPLPRQASEKRQGTKSRCPLQPLTRSRAMTESYFPLPVRAFSAVGFDSRKGQPLESRASRDLGDTASCARAAGVSRSGRSLPTIRTSQALHFKAWPPACAHDDLFSVCLPISQLLTKTFQPWALVLTFRRTSLCESREQSLEVSWHFAQALQC